MRQTRACSEEVVLTELSIVLLVRSFLKSAGHLEDALQEKQSLQRHMTCLAIMSFTRSGLFGMVEITANQRSWHPVILVLCKLPWMRAYVLWLFRALAQESMVIL